MFEGKTILKTEATIVSNFVQQLRVNFTDGTYLIVTPSPLNGLWIDTVGEDGRGIYINPENLNS